MPLDHQRRAIFIHIPKTGGTSIEQALGIFGGEDPTRFEDPFRLFGRQLQHLTAADIREKWMNERCFNEYFKFCFVRNPWERLVSEYIYLKNRKVVDCTFRHLCHPVVLRDNKHPQFLLDHLRPQSDYIYDERGGCLVDFIGRFENLVEDWKKVCMRLGDPLELPVSNKGEYRPYLEYYDEDSKRWVEDVYSEDIERFGYRFGD